MHTIPLSQCTSLAGVSPIKNEVKGFQLKRSKIERLKLHHPAIEAEIVIELYFQTTPSGAMS
jgi:hypothetical protein